MPSPLSSDSIPVNPSIAGITARIELINRLRDLTQRQLTHSSITETTDKGEVVLRSRGADECAKLRSRAPCTPSLPPRTKTKLLTADDERDLIQLIECTRWIFDLEEDLNAHLKRRPPAAILVLALLLQTQGLISHIAAIARHTNRSDLGLVALVLDPAFRANLDYLPEPDLVSVLVTQTNDTERAADHFFRVSILTRILPKLDELHNTGITGLIDCSPSVLVHLAGHETDCRRIINSIKQAGADAEYRFVAANQGLIWTVVERHGHSMPKRDLIQEANIGLLRAIEKFDYRRGFKFSTYATNWIRQAISRAAADQSRSIRLPVHMDDQIRKLHTVSERLSWTLGYEPDDDEIATEMSISVEQLKRIRSAQFELSPLAEHREPPPPTWLEEFVEDDPALRNFDEPAPEPVEAIPDHRERSAPEQFYLRRERSEAIADALSTLTDREQRIIKLRFGLEGNERHTLEEIGREFDVTRERIRQLEAQALRKLRKPELADALRAFLE